MRPGSTRRSWDDCRWQAAWPNIYCGKSARGFQPAQSFEKNQLGLGRMFFNSLRLTWQMSLWADTMENCRFAN